MDNEGKAWALIIVGIAAVLCVAGAAPIVLGAIGMIALMVLCCFVFSDCS